MKNNLKKLLVVLFIFGLFMLVGCGEEANDEPKLVIIETEVEMSPKQEYCIDYSIVNGVEDTIEFTSSDEKIAEVDDGGYIVAKKVGDCVVTVKLTLSDGTILTEDVKVNVGYIVTLNAGSNATISETSFLIGTDETHTLPIPTKEHADFLGWLEVGGSDEYVTEAKNITKNTTFRAVWNNQFLVKYELNGGTYSKTEEYVYDGDVVELGEATKEGNKFLGWSSTSTASAYISSTTVHGNCTLYAMWEPKRIYVSFECDGGTYTGPKYAVYGDNLKLGSPHKFGYTFVGWTLEKGSTNYISTLNNLTDDVTVYAVWEEGNTNSDFMVTNLPEDGVPYLEDLQLNLAYSSTSLNNAKVSYNSSDSKIFSVTDTGKISTLKCGIATLTITVKGTETLTQEVEIVVYIPGRFDVSYETTSYVTVGETIKLNAKHYNRKEELEEIAFRSESTTIANVSSDGTVTGVSEGLATIVAYVKNNPSTSFSFLVTVVSKDASAGLKYIMSSHNSNVFTRYDLGIGAGAPVYDADIIGSVSNVLLTEGYEINRKWEATQAANSNHGGKMTSVEFITVHYTGNMAKGADANGNASYFSQTDSSSIHYTTGNDGIYHILDDSLVGWHAGDGTGVTFQWYKTGVKVKDTDPEYPVWGISENSKFTINGTETICDVPEGKTENTKRVTKDTFYANGAEQPCINKMGLAWKIVDGEYYMGTTWWCYSQVGTGRICNHGGNNNSIGIESCVNEGSDLWYTWHKTAQLVAHLMVEHDLDIYRVVGHHFYTAKDCPQPMLENDLEIWWKFIEMVKAEYQLITTFQDYTFEYTGLSGIESNTERATQNNDAKLITYKVKVTYAGKSEEITLSSVLNGIYEK